MATHQLTRALGNLSVSGCRPPSAATPSFSFCSCMRGRSLLGAHPSTVIAKSGPCCRRCLRQLALVCLSIGKGVGILVCCGKRA